MVVKILGGISYCWIYRSYLDCL